MNLTAIFCLARLCDKLQHPSSRLCALQPLANTSKSLFVLAYFVEFRRMLGRRTETLVPFSRRIQASSKTPNDRCEPDPGLLASTTALAQTPLAIHSLDNPVLKRTSPLSRHLRGGSVECWLDTLPRFVIVGYKSCDPVPPVQIFWSPSSAFKTVSRIDLAGQFAGSGTRILTSLAPMRT